jgi:hypothetical protein
MNEQVIISNSYTSKLLKKEEEIEEVPEEDFG